MKKKLLIGAILAALMVAVFAGEYVHHGFSVKCARCVELQHNGDSGIQVQIAWRTHEYKTVDGKTYALYRCQGGHSYWAEIR